MKIEPGDHCPILDHKCIEFKCKWWRLLRGTNPQSGEEIDEYDCAIPMLLVMACENAKETRQTAASIDSFRNVMVKQGELVLALTSQVGDHEEER